MKHYDVQWPYLLGFALFVLIVILLDHWHKRREIREAHRKQKRHHGFARFKSNHQRIRERTARRQAEADRAAEAEGGERPPP